MTIQTTDTTSDLTEAQQMVRDSAREFAEKRLKPTALEFDEKEAIPRALYQEAAVLGFLGVMFPEEFGGLGLDYLAYIVAMEEISRGCASAGVIMSVNNVNVVPRRFRNLVHVMICSHFLGLFM